MKRFQFFILILIFGLLFFPECSAYCQDKPTLSDVKVSSISEGILTSLTVAPSSSEYHFIIRIYDEEGNFIFDGYSAGINKIVPADSKKSQKIEILSPYIYFQKSGKIKLMVHIEEETDAERGDYQYVSQNRYLDDIPPLKKLSEQQFTVLKSDVKANSKLDGVNGVLLSYIVKFSNPDFLIFREKADDDTHYYFTVHVADEQGFPVYFPDLDFKSSASSSYCRKVLARKEKDTSKVSFFIPYFLMTAPPGDYNLSFRLQVTDVAQKIAFPSPASVEAKVKLQALSVLSLDLDTFEVTGSSKSKTTPDYGFTVSCGAFVRNDPADKKFWKPIFFIAHPDDEFRISLTDKNVTSGNNSSGEIKFKVKDANPEIKKDKATASNVKYNKLSITKRPFQYFDRGKQVLSDQAGKTGDVSGVYSSLQYDLGETVWSKEMKIYPILAGKSEIERMFPYLVYENGVQTAYSTPEWRPSARNEEDNKTGQFDVMVPNIALNENGKAIGYEFQFGPGNVQYVFGKNYYTAGKTNDIIIRDVLNTLSYDNTTECNYVRIEFETEIPNFYMKNGTIRTFYTMSDEKHPETYKILFDNHLENGYYSDFQGMANNNNIDISIPVYRLFHSSGGKASIVIETNGLVWETNRRISDTTFISSIDLPVLGHVIPEKIELKTGKGASGMFQLEIQHGLDTISLPAAKCADGKLVWEIIAASDLWYHPSDKIRFVLIKKSVDKKEVVGEVLIDCGKMKKGKPVSLPKDDMIGGGKFYYKKV